MNNKKLLSFIFAASILSPNIGFSNSEANEAYPSISINDVEFSCGDNPNNSIDNEINNLLVSSDLLIIADTNHSNVEIRDFIADEIFLNSLLKANIGEILLEVPLELQDILDKHSDNDNFIKDDFLFELKANLDLIRHPSVSDDEYERMYVFYADLMEYSINNEVKISFIDSQESTEPVLNDDEKILHKEIVTIIENEGFSNTADLHGKLTTQQSKFLIEYMTEINRLRNDDRNLAKRVKDKVDNNKKTGKKTAIIYGSNHFTKGNEYGLDEQLNKLNISYKAIEIHKSVEDYNGYILRTKNNRYSPSVDSAYLINENCLNSEVKKERENRGYIYETDLKF